MAVKTLHLLGAEIKGYALAPYTENDIFHVINGSKISQSVIADIRKRKNLPGRSLHFNPTLSFILPHSLWSGFLMKYQQRHSEVNAIGTAYLLDAVRQLPGKCQVVLITTDKVYHNNEWVHPYRETDTLGGYDPYSASKACAELVISSYRNSFFNTTKYEQHGKAIAVARAGNVIGGGDWSKDRLVPDIVRALIAGKEVVIRNPHSLRPWQHVMEPVVGYLKLGVKLVADPVHFSEAYNFGPYAEDTMKVEDVVKCMINNFQSGTYSVKEDTRHPHEANLLKLDISKAVAALEWKPQFNAQTAIAQTANWYKEFMTNRGGMEEYTGNQIRNFLHA